jgi:hypothetical protein
MMCAHEPSTHNHHSIHIIVDIMLSLDNQLIEEVIGSMETAGHPYWATVERWRRWLSSMMAKSTQFFATAFSRRRATKAPSYHGPYVFLEKCRWSYISWLSIDSEYCWWYTLWKFDNSMSSNCRTFVFLRGSYIQKNLTTQNSLATQSSETSYLRCLVFLCGNAYLEDVPRNFLPLFTFHRRRENAT